jgi:glycine/D-amino acid oxidase-like deaminating enzyme
VTRAGPALLMSVGDRTGSRAVVLGGGVAGLLTAAVLTDFCPEVVVVDRDTLPEGTKDRKGTPQGRHAQARRTPTWLGPSSG